MLFSRQPPLQASQNVIHYRMPGLSKHFVHLPNRQQDWFDQKEGMFEMVWQPAFEIPQWFQPPDICDLVQLQWTGLMWVTNRLLQEWQRVTSEARCLGDTNCQGHLSSQPASPLRATQETGPLVCPADTVTVTAQKNSDQNHTAKLTHRTCEEYLLPCWAAEFGAICYTAQDNQDKWSDLKYYPHDPPRIHFAGAEGGGLCQHD